MPNQLLMGSNKFQEEVGKLNDFDSSYLPVGVIIL